MIATTLLVLSTAAAAATLLVLRRLSRTADGPDAESSEPMAMAPLPPRTTLPPARATAAPVRSVNPKLTGKDSGLWELVASDKCEFAGSLKGKRMETADTIALPLPGCNAMTCTCHYVQVREARRGARRKGEERREELRFDVKKVERRAKDRRRRRSIWDGKK